MRFIGLRHLTNCLHPLRLDGFPLVRTQVIRHHGEGLRNGMYECYLLVWGSLVQGCLLLDVSVLSISATVGRVLSARTSLPFFSAGAALVASSREEVALVVHPYC